MKSVKWGVYGNYLSPYHPVTDQRYYPVVMEFEAISLTHPWDDAIDFGFIWDDDNTIVLIGEDYNK